MSLITAGNRKWWALAGVSLANFLGCVDLTIVNTALPALQQSLNVGLSDLQWVMNIFLLALCAFMVVMGRLGDLFGRRKLLYIGMAAFGLASLGAGLSTSLGMLVFFRLIQGIATAILYTAAGAITAHTFEAQERGRAMGILFGISGIGLAIGPVLGGIIVGALSWHWVFLVNVPVILLGFLICIPSILESKSAEEGETIDYKGVGLLAVGLAILVLALVKGSTWGWASPLTLIAFAIALLSLVSLYFVEKKQTFPIIKFELFCNRGFISSVIATASLGFFYCLAFFVMPLFLHNVFHFSGYKLGLMLLPTTAVMALVSPLVGRLTDKVGPKLLLLTGLAFFALSASMQLFFNFHSSLIYIGLAFSAMGIGWASLLGPATVAALSSVPEKISGVAMGSSWTMHNMGGVFGLALGTLIYHFAEAHTQYAHLGFLSGYHAVMALLVAVTTAAWLAILFVMP